MLHVTISGMKNDGFNAKLRPKSTFSFSRLNVKVDKNLSCFFAPRFVISFFYITFVVINKNRNHIITTEKKLLENRAPDDGHFDNNGSNTSIATHLKDKCHFGACFGR